MRLRWLFLLLISLLVVSSVSAATCNPPCDSDQVCNAFGTCENDPACTCGPKVGGCSLSYQSCADGCTCSDLSCVDDPVSNDCPVNNACVDCGDSSSCLFSGGSFSCVETCQVDYSSRANYCDAVCVDGVCCSPFWNDVCDESTIDYLCAGSPVKISSNPITRVTDGVSCSSPSGGFCSDEVCVCVSPKVDCDDVCQAPVCVEGADCFDSNDNLGVCVLEFVNDPCTAFCDLTSCSNPDQCLLDNVCVDKNEVVTCENNILTITTACGVSTETCSFCDFSTDPVSCGSCPVDSCFGGNKCENNILYSCNLDGDCGFWEEVETCACNVDGTACQGVVDVDGDGYNSSVDCNDTNVAINPSSEEVCDGFDNDCDLVVDDGVCVQDYFCDVDSDGKFSEDPITCETFDCVSFRKF